jgi:uncharacterized protein YfkK (UPF0435 family)
MITQNKNLLFKINEITSKLTIIDELVAENLRLKDRMNSLEEKINKLESAKRCDVTEVNSIAAEIEDRNRRRNNVIVCNMEESVLTERREIVNDDTTKVFNFLKNANGSLSYSDLRCFRLGRGNNGKPRPIKVVLRSQNQVAEVMKNKFQLSNQYAVYRDQTVIQRNQYIKLREELNSRVKNGEKNLAIKFIKGCPKIVNNNNNSKNSIATFKTLEV